MSASGVILLGLRLGAALALYLFLALAFWLIWRDLQQAGAELAAPHISGLVLVNRLKPGEIWQLEKPEMRLGRDPSSDCCLDDPTVSLVHARLAYHHGQWWLADLGSRNGTFVNDLPVNHSQVVMVGDELRFGQVSLHLEQSGTRPDDLSTPGLE